MGQLPRFLLPEGGIFRRRHETPKGGMERQDLGRRAAALALAAGMTLSVVPGVLAVDADEVLTPPAQTAEQEPETGEPEEPAEEPADSEEEKPAASDAEGGGTELPADSETRQALDVMAEQFTTFGTASVMVGFRHGDPGRLR